MEAVFSGYNAILNCHIDLWLYCKLHAKQAFMSTQVLYLISNLQIAIIFYNKINF